SNEAGTSKIAGNWRFQATRRWLASNIATASATWSTIACSIQAGAAHSSAPRGERSPLRLRFGPGKDINLSPVAAQLRCKAKARNGGDKGSPECALYGTGSAGRVLQRGRTSIMLNRWESRGCGKVICGRLKTVRI